MYIHIYVYTYVLSYNRCIHIYIYIERERERYQWCTDCTTVSTAYFSTNARAIVIARFCDKTCPAQNPCTTLTLMLCWFDMFRRRLATTQLTGHSCVQAPCYWDVPPKSVELNVVGFVCLLHVYMLRCYTACMKSCQQNVLGMAVRNALDAALSRLSLATCHKAAGRTPECRSCNTPSLGALLSATSTHLPTRLAWKIPRQENTQKHEQHKQT